MFESPEDPHAARVLSALRQAAHESPSADPQTIEKARDFLGAVEANPATTPRNPGEKILHDMVALSKAREGGNPTEANRIETALHSEVAGQTFPWERTMALAQAFHMVAAAKEPFYVDYNKMTDHVIPGRLPNDAKIAIIGDWGTGEDDAAYLLAQMLKNPLFGGKNPAAILHLGDIYEAGTVNEVKTEFLMPLGRGVSGKSQPGDIPVFAVPGDHEYFGNRGEGFFGMLDSLNHNNGAQWKQTASYFCLRTQNGRWQILGADTGVTSVKHAEPGLNDREADWHRDKIANFGGNTVFLTHRQLVCARRSLDNSAAGNLQYYNTALLKSMKDMLPDIDLFLWGHEHIFTAFDEGQISADLAFQNPSLPGKFQLLGGSSRHDPVGPWLFSGMPVSKAPDQCGSYYNHSYGILDLGTSPATISYFQTAAWKGDEMPDAATLKACGDGTLLQVDRLKH